MFSSLLSDNSFIYRNPSKRNRGGPQRTEPATDLEKWRLSNVDGRQTWHFLNSDDLYLQELNRPQTFLEKHLLGIDETVTTQPKGKKSLNDAISSAAKFLCSLQGEDGHWPGDYGGPLFLMPGLIISCHVTNTQLEMEQKLEMIRYLRSVQCPNGGWGLHTEGPPTVLGTALNYVSMRLLGVSPKDPVLLKALELLHSLGGTASIPSWGKFWLSILNLYRWEGMNTLLPELWCLPECLPFHPSKMWCHCRQVYLGMSYCYGVRFVGEETELINQLREELYNGEYHSIDWSKQRNKISEADLYTPHSHLLDSVFCLANAYETCHISSFRKKSVDLIHEHVCFDDEVTDCISIGPVSKTIQMIVRWHRDGPDSNPFKKHQERVRDYLWLGKDGMKMSGTNGSQLWDTAFALQALLESKKSLNLKMKETLLNGKQFLEVTQISKQNPDFEKYYRQPNKGGFPFSTRDCGWIVFDCTAEGIKALMMLNEDDELVEEFQEEKSEGYSRDAWDAEERCKCNVDLLLSGQNKNGGYASYEKKRGGVFLEMLNPSEVFGDIMIDYTYVECTSAVMQALKYFTDHYPKYRSQDIMMALKQGFDFVLKSQREDGSWYGSWGVCFTYGSWFGLEAFACMGLDYKSSFGFSLHPQLLKACNWLVSKQNLMDGGWGENFESCELKEYVPSPTSQIVNTAWALLGLMAVRYPNVGVIERGIELLLSRQLANGDFPQENISGVFNKSCSIHYDLYRNIFPLWALSRYRATYKHFDAAECEN